MFGNTQIGILLFITHFISCLLVGFFFRFWRYNAHEKMHISKQNISSKQEVTFSNFGEILANSIFNAVNTIIMIGGFVIIFSVIICILNNCGLFNVFYYILSPLFNFIGLSKEYITPIISGICELTNGLNLVSSITAKTISNNIVITAFLLGFGGISILLQVLSITSKSDISIKPYFYGKLLQLTDDIK